MSKFWKRFLITVTALFGLGLISILGFMYYVYQVSIELPSAAEISKFKYTEPMVVYDSAGTVLAELGAERRYPIAIENMPVYMGQAVVAVEDSRFYEHKGVDLLGISRAFISNIKAGRVVEGGSTLTQQLVKIIYLTPEKKMIRKLKEAIIAYRIDNYLPKDKILELYLNQVNFGRGAYGVQAAAINYFGKNVGELTLAEAALIAGIPKAPAYYSPHINLERSLQRRNHVLYRMYETGYITETQYNESVAEVPAIVESVPLKLKYAGYFMDHIHKYLTEELKINPEQYMGLKIYTTLKLDYQLAAESAVRDNLFALSKREGFSGPIGVYKEESPEPELVENGQTDAIMLKSTKNPLTDTPGYLLQYGIRKARVTTVNANEVTLVDAKGVEGRLELKSHEWAKPIGSDTNSKLQDFRLVLKPDDIVYISQDPKRLEIFYLEQDPQLESALISVDPKTGAIYAMVGGFSYEKSFFNRATQAKRQTGSTFKPIVYATAFESGFVPMDVMLDVPIISEEEDGENVWKPKNYEDKFHGKTTLKEALIKSRNVVTVKLAEKLGIRKIISYARSFGFTSDMPNDLSVSLGSASASVLEMAYAYSVFANQGTRPSSPYFITKIEDIDGNLLYEFQPREQVRVIEPTSAGIMAQILVDVVEQGSGWRAKAVRRVVGAKTGTTNDSKDAWFAGIMPNLVTITWVGYDDFRKLGDYATGSSAAAPAWVNYTTSIVATLPFEAFPLNDKLAYFKVDPVTFQITDSLRGAYSFEIYPIDDMGNPTKIVRQQVQVVP